MPGARPKHLEHVYFLFLTYKNNSALFDKTFTYDKTRSISAKKVKIHRIICRFDTNINHKEGDKMNSNESKQQLQQKKQNQSSKKDSGNPKLDGENRPAT